MFILEASPTFSLIDNLSQLIILVSALAIQSIVNWLRAQKPKKQMTGNLETIMIKVDKMEKELSPNGGTSMKDMVTNTHHQVIDLQTKVKAISVQQRARLEMQLNSSLDYYMLFNEDGECIFANDALVNLVSIAKEDLLYSGWVSMIHTQEERERVIELFDSAVTRQIGFRECTTICNARTKEKFSAEISSKPIWDDEGNPLWFSGKIKVIT